MNNSIVDSIFGEKFSINVDTIEFRVQKVKADIADVEKMMVTSSAGEVRFTRTNRKGIEGRYGRHALNVRFRQLPGALDGELSIEGSPYAYSYGQNVFTFSSVQRACFGTLQSLSRKLKFDVSDDTYEQWQDGEIELDRVDLAVNFRLESEEQVYAAIKQLKRQIIEQDCQSNFHTRWVSWSPRNGKHYNVAAYAKGSQMRVKRAGKVDALYDKLVDECACILRVELRLRGEELRKLNLHLAKGWTAARAREVFKTYFSRLPLLEVMSGPLRTSDLDNIPKAARAYYALQSLGVSSDYMRRVCSDRTISRYRTSLRQAGIDPNCPGNPVPALSLAHLLRGRAMRTPLWLIEASLAPTTLKRTRQLAEAKAQQKRTVSAR
jgi:hypothetical protein